MNSKIQAEKQKQFEERQTKYAFVACTIKRGDPIIMWVNTGVVEIKCTFVKCTQNKMSYQRNDNGVVSSVSYIDIAYMSVGGVHTGAVPSASSSSASSSSASAPSVPSSSVDTPAPPESSDTQTVQFPDLPAGVTDKERKDYTKLKNTYHASVRDAKKAKDLTHNQRRQKTNLDNALNFFKEVNGAITNRATGRLEGTEEMMDQIIRLAGSAQGITFRWT